ncbi:MAG: hypothetical protein IKB09_09790 [Oscillospiraceae bacterium]|nr:hypothetical protein [Oscillospiraceae bacterium]MBR6595152.1 hypothetical protein [Oscillospiraceae bacterium]
MNEMIINVAIQILGELALALIGVAGAWLMAKLAERQKLASIAAATNEVVGAAVETVSALRQTTVEKLKAAHEDGKLTEDEVKDLGKALLEMTMKKLSAPAVKVLEAAGKDIAAMIQDAAEAWIGSLKNKG